MKTPSTLTQEQENFIKEKVSTYGYGTPGDFMRLAFQHANAETELDPITRLNRYGVIPGWVKRENKLENENNDLRSQIIGLMVEIEEFSKDKKRLQFLIDNQCAPVRQLAGLYFVGHVTADRTIWKVTENFKTAREAIDEGMRSD